MFSYEKLYPYGHTDSLYCVNNKNAIMFTGKRFLARVDALLDIYQVIAEGSRSLQRVQSLPWETMKDFNSTMITLKNMTNTLESRRNPSIPEMHDLAEIDTIWPALSLHGPLDQNVVSMMRKHPDTILKPCSLDGFTALIICNSAMKSSVRHRVFG